MRGLLVKDFRLLRQRSRFFVLLVGIAVLMAASGSKYGGGFVSGYLTLVTALFSVSTISYDEYDNCYCFLMTLPINRRTYVREKYLLGVILGLAAWLVGTVICTAALYLLGQQGALAEELVESLAYIPTFLAIIALTLPFQLKYGAERGRLVLLAVVGGPIALLWILNRALQSAGPSLTGMATRMSGWKEWQILAGFFLLAAAAVCLSLCISVRIMEKKEL